MEGGPFQYVPYFFGLFALVFYVSFSRLRKTPLLNSDRALVSSCLASLAHGVPAGVLAGWQVYKAYPIRIDAVNEPEQERLVQFTLAYMLADTLLYLLPYTPTDFLFCTHHTVVIVYAVSALVGGRGAISYIILTLIGECTSLWQNSWYICKVFKSQSEAARRTFGPLSYVYPAAYVLARSLVGPPAVLWICKGLWTTQYLPATTKGTWLTICALSLAGSQIWSYKLLEDLARNRGATAESAAEKLS